MIEAIVKATSLPKYIESAEPFAEPPKLQHAIIVGGTHLLTLSNLFPQYAVQATVIIPHGLPPLDVDHEFERALEFEDMNAKRCKAVGIARDLGGFDTDSADMLLICSQYPLVRDTFLSQASRVIRDGGKVVVFTPSEISLTHLGKFGIANPTYYPVEGFYVGTMRQAGSLYRRN